MVWGTLENRAMSNIVTRIKRALWLRVVLRTDQNYRFVYGDDERLSCREAIEGDPTPWFVLVGRAQCYELRTPIPNVDLAEATKIADNMPVSSPFGGNVRRNRLLVKSEGTSAHITLIRQASIDTWLNRPVFLLPATWLVDRLVDEKPSVVALPGEIVGIAPSNSGYQSRLLDGSDIAEADFWWSSGTAPDLVQRFEESEVVSSLGTAIAGLSWRDWVEAFWRPEVDPLERLKSLDWRSASLLATLAFSIYMVITSAALMSMSWFFDRQLANEPDAFTDVLALRAETNQLRARDRAWSDAVGEQHATWAVWPPVLEVWEDDVVVTGLSLADGRAEVFMSADTATTVLTAFKQSAYVAEADFGQSVRRDRRLERDSFSIVWTVVDRGERVTESSAVESDNES